MSVIFLTSGDRREAEMRQAIADRGWQIDAERSAFGDAEVCAWGIQDPPCVIKLHNGRSVYEASKPGTLPSWADAQAAMQQAVDACEAAKAGQ